MKYTITKEYPLKEKMDKKKLNIRQLAEKAGVHYTYISRLLTGKSHATEEMKNKLDAVL
jgi:plasmid maintenance system antidote protein VapI